MIYLKKNPLWRYLRRPYAEVYAEGLARMCYANLFFNGECLQRLGLTQKPYAEALRGALGNFFRICHTRKVLREPFAEALHGGLTRSYFSMGNACNGLVLRGSLTRGPYAGIFLISFFFNKSLYRKISRNKSRKTIPFSQGF